MDQESPKSTAMAAAVAALRTRPIAITDKGFGVLASRGTVTAAGLAESRPSLLGGDFTMPLLVLRSSALEHNIAAMAGYCASSGVWLAPHGKTTMAPQLFARQLAAGAWGVTAATIGHVQAYREFGVSRVLLANELTDSAGIAWLAGEMAADPGFDCYVYADSVPGVRLLDEVLRAHGALRALPVLVELGHPGGRTGCRDVPGALTVAQAVAGTATLRLAGAAGYEGGLGHDRSPATRATVAGYCRDLRKLGEALATAVDSPPELVLTAGGSAFYDLVVAELATPPPPGVRVVLRSGAYITYDHGLYAGLSPGDALDGIPDLRPALELWTQVLSRPEPDLALLCAGRRDVAFDAGLPLPLRVHHADGSVERADQWHVFQLADQHAFMRVSATAALGPGDLVCLGISHPCTTFDKWRVIPVVDDGYHVVDAIHTFF